MHTAAGTVRIAAPLLLAVIPAVTPTATAAQSEPSTRAESTAYMETSRYDDVVEFIDTIVPQSEWLHLGSMGFTH